MGSEYELPRKSADLAFFGNDKDGIINLTLKKEELNVLRFNPKTLEQTAADLIELPEATKHFRSETVVNMGKNYYWMHRDFDKKSERTSLYYDKIDVITGNITAANQKMLESYEIGGRYYFNYNAEGNLLLISYMLTPIDRRDKNNIDIFGFFVYDENMNKIWGGEYKMPYEQSMMNYNGYSIDSKGNAYMLVKIIDDTKTAHLEVLKFTKENKAITRTPIAVNDYYIKESSLIESPAHEMIIASTYSKKGGKGTDGVFLAKIDTSGKVSKYKSGFYEFSLAELQKFEKEKTQKRMEKNDKEGEYEAPDLTVRNINIETDGSILIACEEYYITQQTSSYTSSNGMVSYRTISTYHYDDILAAKINAKGEYQWLRKIPKKQRGIPGMGGLPGTMGYKLISDTSGCYFLYLDNKKNMDLTEDEEPKAHIDGEGGQLMVAKISNTGIVTKELLFDTKEEDVMVFPQKFSKINSNQFIGRAKTQRNVYRPLLITTN
ncbi:MAG: hypothetical protein HY305_05855 [Sphingobacteriales bacterium]|nr:hypothetical protein [Sphingobacteriales bacterium]